MKLRRTHLLLLCLCLCVVCLTGCTSTWITAVGAALPTLSALVTAIATFIAALAGKTVAQNVSDAIAKITADVQAQITNVQAIIAAYKATPNPTLLGEISAVLNAILANLASILTGFSIVDSSTVARLAQLVGLGVAAVLAILALVPLLVPGPGVGGIPELSEAQKKTLGLHQSAFKATYNTIRTAPSGSVEVDAALATLKPM